MDNSKIEINLMEHSELLNNFFFVKYCLRNNIITQETIIGGRTLLDYSIVNKRRMGECKMERVKECKNRGVEERMN